MQQLFAISIKNTPLRSDSLEMVLLPGSVMRVIEEQDDLLQVTTNEYASTKPLYVDRRFVTICKEEPKEREKRLPSRKEMLERLHAFPKLPYVWGGNVPEGVPELLTYNPPPKQLSSMELLEWQLKGVDCSGLVYAITNGWTKRNSSDIYVIYPEVKTVKPLDLIVWPGHVMIVLSHDQIIESRKGDGIVRSNLKKRLSEVERWKPKIVRFD